MPKFTARDPLRHPIIFLYRINNSGVKIRPALKKIMRKWKDNISKIIITCQNNLAVNCIRKTFHLRCLIGFWICRRFWICQSFEYVSSSEYAMVTPGSENAGIGLNNSWICLNMPEYVWISLNMLEGAWIYLNMLE